MQSHIGFGTKLEQVRRDLQMQVEQIEQARAASPVLNPVVRVERHRRRMGRHQMMTIGGIAVLLLAVNVSLVSNYLHYRPEVRYRLREMVGLSTPRPNLTWAYSTGGAPQMLGLPAAAKAPAPAVPAVPGQLASVWAPPGSTPR